MLNIRRYVAAGIGAVALAGIPTIADATPASGVTARVISQITVGGKDYILREITLAPGGSTGWHYHNGALFALVKRGMLTHNSSNCSVDGVYSAGSAFKEPSGAGNVHIGRNLGSTPVVLDVLYVDPAGSPLSEDAPNPGCAFQ